MGREEVLVSWTKVTMASACDIADPGWENASAPESACDLDANETFVFNERNHVLDTGYQGSTSGWRTVRMRSACDE